MPAFVDAMDLHVSYEHGSCLSYMLLGASVASQKRMRSEGMLKTLPTVAQSRSET
jgi:hypothetical protein